MIFRLPGGKTARGKVVADAVSLADLMPTILQLAGQPIPKEAQGRSLVPLTMGEADGLWQYRRWSPEPGRENASNVETDEELSPRNAGGSSRAAQRR